VESATGELVLRAGSSAAVAIAAESVEHTLTATAMRLLFEGMTKIPEPHTREFVSRRAGTADILMTIFTDSRWRTCSSEDCLAAAPP
jgi:hypothetical protein